MEKSKPKHVYFIILCVFLILLVVVLIWDLFVQRIYGNPFKPVQEFKGRSYIDFPNYLEFEKGELFVDSFLSFDFSNQCAILDFYYINNQHQDSLYYGVCPDVYGLTLDAGENYDEIKSYIQRVGTDRGDYLVPSKDGRHVTFYSMPIDSKDGRDLFVFAVGQDTPFLRFILITEYSEADWENPRYVVSTHSSMDWS